MMHDLTLIAIGLALVFLGLQVVWAWRLAACYPPKKTLEASKEKLPRAAVILSIRGADPSLVDCIRCLLRQDYPDYEVHIVIDNVHDAAWDLLRPLLDEETKVRVHLGVLETKHATCSLKVSAIAQAIGELNASVQVVALIDADVIPYKDWLRDLVLPLRDPRIGATTGIRWYQPESADWGSLIRCLWNAAACAQMLAFHIPWGGSMAFRAHLFRDTDLLEEWKRCFCEDTISYSVLRRLGFQVCVVPKATMVNPERIALKDCFSFIRRQLLTVRLHHPRWPQVWTAGIGAGLTLLLLFGIFAASAATGDFYCAGLVAGTIASFVAGLASAMLWIKASLRLTAHERGVTVAGFSWKLMLAAPLTQIMYLAALLSASFLRKVDWRGIRYELYGPTTVRLTQYQPYHPDIASPKRAASLV
jgi:glycosyltransferase involved in cell wall biosynthesis